MTPETRYAKNGEVFIAYQVTGQGPDTLVYAPGTVSHLDLDWEFPLRGEFFQRLSSMFCSGWFVLTSGALACPIAPRQWLRWNSAPMISVR